MAENKQILLVEDDKRLAELIKTYLTIQGYKVITEADGATACERITCVRPDLVILDLMLPGKDGLSICREVRADYKGPIIILTAKEDDMDQVAGLEIGADDYIKKPVEPRVLLARMRALFRRIPKTFIDASKSKKSSSLHKVGGLEINVNMRNVMINGQVISLSSTEFDLLSIFIKYRGEIVDRGTISKELRGIDYDGMDRSIDISVSRLRKKLGAHLNNSFKIKTVWGKGYIFAGDVDS